MNPNDDEELSHRLSSQNVKDQGKHAPHVLFIRDAERVSEAMALGRDPYPAFCAWQSGLAIWANEDKVFRLQARRVDAVLEETYRAYGGLPRLEYVRAWRPLYFGVMRRMGLFEAVDAAHNRNRHLDLGVN